MGNFISSLFTSQQSAAAKQAAIAEAQARVAEAQARQAKATAEVSKAKFLNSVYEVPSVDAVEEQRKQWQNDNQAKVQAMRKLYETDPLASVVVNKIVENEVGNGPEMEAATGVAEVNDKIERLWYGWRDNAEVTGLSWDEFCSLAKTHYLVDGDVGTVLLNDYADEVVGSGKIQLITADQITSGNQGNGVLTDDIGAVLGYNIESTPGNGSFYPASAVVFMARRKAIRDSLHRRKYRGDSVFASNYELFTQAAKWNKAEVNAAIAAARIVFILTKNNAAGWQGNSQGSGGDRQLDMSGASVPVLEPGEDLKPFQGSHPTNNYSEPFRLLVRQLGAETGIPLEMLLLDFSTGSFASVRTALIFTQRAFKQHQQQFISRFVMPIYKWRLSRWVSDGKITAADIAAVNAAGGDIYNVNFTLPKWVVIDPLKEAMTEQVLRDLKQSTLRDWCNEQGIDYAEQLDKVQREQEEFAKRGLQQFHANTSAITEAVAANDNQDVMPMNTTDKENADVMQQ